MESLTFSKLVELYNDLDQKVDCLICFEKIGFGIECEQCNKLICSDCIFKIIDNNVIKVSADDLNFNHIDYNLMGVDSRDDKLVFQKKEKLLYCPYCNFSSDLDDLMGFKIINFKYVTDTEHNKNLKREIILKYL